MICISPKIYSHLKTIIKDMSTEKGDFDDDSRVGVDVNSYSINIARIANAVTITLYSKVTM